MNINAQRQQLAALRAALGVQRQPHPLSAEGQGATPEHPSIVAHRYGEEARDGDVAALAAHIGVSPQTVYAYIKIANTFTRGEVDDWSRRGVPLRALLMVTRVRERRARARLLRQSLPRGGEWLAAAVRKHNAAQREAAAAAGRWVDRRGTGKPALHRRARPRFISTGATESNALERAVADVTGSIQTPETSTSPVAVCPSHSAEIQGL